MSGAMALRVAGSERVSTATAPCCWYWPSGAARLGRAKFSSTSAREDRSAVASGSGQKLGRLGREIGDDPIGARPLEGGERLHDGAVLVEPAILRGRLDHRVFAGD